MRRPLFTGSFALPGEIVVDNFAGGGGASTGIEAALGRPVDIAINHDPEAIAMHKANHPETKHFCENICEVSPREACAGRPVGLAWFSPDCTHFSRAKGGKPVKKEIRGLADVVIRWAREVSPRVIVLENVEEFQTWGPVIEDPETGKCYPDPAHAGDDFRRWLGELSGLSYTVEFKTLVAADYGAPTTRKRFYLIARRDGRSPAWPLATHGKGLTFPWRSAAEIIDWHLPCPSIFARKRALKPATLRRIAEGIRRYVVEAAEPFVMPLTHHGWCGAQGISRPVRMVTAANRGELALVAPFMAKHYSGVAGHKLQRPIGTITSQDHHALVIPSLLKFYGTSIGQPITEPVPTVTAGGDRGGGHVAALRTVLESADVGRKVEARAFLMKYYGTGVGLSPDEPVHTVTARDRFALVEVAIGGEVPIVTVAGEQYEIVDIGMRMLQPPELYRAQGFPEDYDIAPEFNGKPLTKTAQIRMAGNSVCPPVAAALVGANVWGAAGRVAA